MAYVSAAPPEGTWEKPAICRRGASSVSADNPGKLKKHRWDLIAEYDKFCLFRMCFLEEWIVDVLIPMTNKDLVDKLSLQEFYLFLEIIFTWLASMGSRIGSCGGRPSQSTCSVVLLSGSTPSSPTHASAILCRPSGTQTKQHLFSSTIRFMRYIK
jgi:hypothetical protein